MTAHGLTLAFVLGAAALAAWCHGRFGDRTPESMGRVFAHVAVGLLAVSLLPVPMTLLETHGSPARAAVALFALVLPAFVYCFTGWIWLMRVVQRMLRIG